MQPEGFRISDAVHSTMKEPPGKGHRFRQASISLSRDFKGQDLRIEHPRDGISISLSNYFFEEDTAIPYRLDEGVVTISTFFSGKTSCLPGTSGDKSVLDIEKPCDMMTVSCDCEGRLHIAGGEVVRNVDVVIDRALLLEMTDGDRRFAGLEKSTAGGGGIHLLAAFNTTPNTRLIATQMFGCTLHDSCRRIFMESKALELLAAFLERIGSGPSDSLPLTRRDVECIHEARRLLLEDVAEPPSVFDLARSVGINQHKLKTGFRAVFGGTVFQTLRTHRMEAARAMLMDTDMTVGTVASMVGYTNMSHFIDAFRKEFGVTPGALLSQSRHNSVL